MPTLPIPVLVSSDGTSAVSSLAVRMDSDSMMSPPFAMSCGGVWTEEESTGFVVARRGELEDGLRLFNV